MTAAARLVLLLGKSGRQATYGRVILTAGRLLQWRLEGKGRNAEGRRQAAHAELEGFYDRRENEWHFRVPESQGPCCRACWTQARGYSAGFVDGRVKAVQQQQPGVSAECGGRRVKGRRGTHSSL